MLLGLLFQVWFPSESIWLLTVVYWPLRSTQFSGVYKWEKVGKEGAGRDQVRWLLRIPSLLLLTFSSVFPTSENPNAGNSAQCSGKMGMWLVCWTSIV